jgi:hypothetical protein
LTWGPVDGSHLKVFDFDVGVKAEFYIMYQKDPYDFYKLFVTDDIIEHIAEQTNPYAQQQLRHKGPFQSKKSKPWAPTNTEEIEHFFIIILWMGLLTPQLRDYWSRNFLFETNLKKIMNRNRFAQLLPMLHFNDNEVADNQDQEIDKLHKIRPLMQKLLTRFQDVVNPGRNVCIDETMVPFRGRLKFKQYIKNKRHKFGIKLYKLCLESGYTYDVKIYCGIDTQHGGNASSNVVMSLMSGLLDTGRTLYPDNFYTSVTLAHELIKRKTQLVGTVRTNRKMNCVDVTKQKIKKNEILARESNTGIVMLKWCDKRVVLMLSTKHTNQTKKVQQRGKEVEKSAMIVGYNESKAFIDLSDQMKAYSHCLRRGNKWYRKLATELLFGSAIVNAYVVYKEVTQNKISITDFKKLVVLKLLGQFFNENRDDPKQVGNNHQLVESRMCCYICKKYYCRTCFFY